MLEGGGVRHPPPHPRSPGAALRGCPRTHAGWGVRAGGVPSASAAPGTPGCGGGDRDERREHMPAPGDAPIHHPHPPGASRKRLSASPEET